MTTHSTNTATQTNLIVVPIPHRWTIGDRSALHVVEKLLHRLPGDSPGKTSTELAIPTSRVAKTIKPWARILPLLQLATSNIQLRPFLDDYHLPTQSPWTSSWMYWTLSSSTESTPRYFLGLPPLSPPKPPTASTPPNSPPSTTMSTATFPSRPPNGPRNAAGPAIISTDSFSVFS